MKRRSPIFAIAWFFIVITDRIAASPLSLQGVETNHFRITTFASGLNFPLSMIELPDGSLLATVGTSGSLATTSGRLVRFTDANDDGIADGDSLVLYSGLSGLQTSVRRAGELILVTGQGTPITLLRMGSTTTNTPTLVGQLILNYPGGWIHQHSALGVRKSPGKTNSHEIVFQIGADGNYTPSIRTVTLTNSNVPGAAGTLAGDSIYQFTLIDNGTNVAVTNLIQLASGVRNPAGFAFQPATGDFYFEDNGIDGLIAPNEPLSADELNFIARTNLGTAPPFFGFPTNYTLYRTNTFIGGNGIAPRIAFQPLPDPLTGHESEGANDITFAPPGFPIGLNTGVFIGFHGKFNYGGTNNEENPVIYADPVTGQYFHFIPGQTAGIGHLDGLLATRDSLFIADLAPNGDLFSGGAADTGVIYQIKSLVAPPPNLTAQVTGGQLELRWDRGSLQTAASPDGPWTEVSDSFSPCLIPSTAPAGFYRAAY